MIAVELHNLLADCQTWIGFGSYPPAEIALRLHHRLVKIHLFPNGNGRHARIAADTMLTRQLNAPPIQWIDDADIQTPGPHREAYIAALRAADGHDYAPLLTLYGAS